LGAGTSYIQLANGVAKAASMSAITGKLSRIGPSTFTLDSQLQARFDLWSACLNTPSCTDRQALQKLRDVSVVIMDTSSGSILAAWCHGTTCAKAGTAGPGAMAATLLEAPPASTAKLFFALGLAAHGRVDPQMLQKQIGASLNSL
jgi:membrane peptidoglycan carboxypeptidase